jgi:hypothetical protein
MSTKRALSLDTVIRRASEPISTPDPDTAALTALAVTVALLRALRDRGLLTEGEIDDLFGEAAERLRDTPASNLLIRVQDDVERKSEE